MTTLQSTHPASVIDEARCASTVLAYLLGEGPMWDPFVRDNRPEMHSTEQILDYTMEGAIERASREGIESIEADAEVDPLSPQGRRILAEWCAHRASICKTALMSLTVENDRIAAHRILATHPNDLKPAIGIFWTHSVDEAVDLRPMWAPDGTDIDVQDAPTILIAASVPVEAVDWNVSCMALMDWLVGDSEQELRLLPGHPVQITSCTFWENDSPIVLAPAEWTT